jgi:hypothetical protein
MSIRSIAPFVAGTRPVSLNAENGEDRQAERLARVSLREWTKAMRSSPCPGTGKTGAAQFRSDCPSPNLSKILTIYASTLVEEIQGLGACGRDGLRGFGSV